MCGTLLSLNQNVLKLTKSKVCTLETFKCSSRDVRHYLSKRTQIQAKKNLFHLSPGLFFIFTNIVLKPLCSLENIKVDKENQDNVLLPYCADGHTHTVMGTWHRIPCLKETLNLKATLSGGQSFRWREKSNGEWTGVVGKFVLQVRWGHEKGNGQTHLEFCALGDKATKLTTSELQSRISSYFRLDTNLEKLYEQWANCDPNFKVKATRSDLKGIRILNQEHVENIFSFICSSNNNIARISSMVENMCMLFGQEICTIDSKKYYSFPEVKDLANPNIESKLRKVGFGYRAPFVIGTAKKILEQGGEDWLLQLSEMDYANAKQELMSLPGIGAKVADCICLMSLGHLQAVPVDTHVYQIAVANYTPHLAGRKSVTSKVYNEISNHFQNLYGPMAGWAHTILFCADLRSFQEKKEEGEEEPKQANKKRKKS